MGNEYIVVNLNDPVGKIALENTKPVGNEHNVENFNDPIDEVAKPMDNKYECQELKKIKNHPGLKNEQVVDLVVKYCVPFDKHYLRNSELISNGHNRKKSY